MKDPGRENARLRRSVADPSSEEEVLADLASGERAPSPAGTGDAEMASPSQHRPPMSGSLGGTPTGPAANLLCYVLDFAGAPYGN